MNLGLGFVLHMPGTIYQTAETQHNNGTTVSQSQLKRSRSGGFWHQVDHVRVAAVTAGGGVEAAAQMMLLSSSSVSWLTAMIFASCCAYLAWSCMKWGMRTFSMWARGRRRSTSSYDT